MKRAAEKGIIGDVMARKDKCPVPGCGLDAKVIRFLAEEIIMPVAMPISDLKRIPPFGVVGRNFEVECEVHGKKWIQVEGHHITKIPKEPSKKNKIPESKR